MKRLKSFNDLEIGDYIRYEKDGGEKSAVFKVIEIKNNNSRTATIKKVNNDRKLVIVCDERLANETYVLSRTNMATLDIPRTIYVLNREEALAVIF